MTGITVPWATGAQIAGRIDPSLAGRHTRELVESAVDSLRDYGCHHDLLKIVASVGVIPQLAPDLTVHQRMEATCPACKITGKAAVPLGD